MASGEDHEMQDVIKASLDSYREAERHKSELKPSARQDSGTATKSSEDPDSSHQDEGPIGTPRPTIDDRIEEIIQDTSLRQALEMPKLDDINGDTYIFIDPPQKQPEMSDNDYKHYKQPMKNLLWSTGIGKLPNNIRYVIDLTPPNEGEEAVHLTTMLCCSEGVRLWYQANAIWSVSTLLAGGEEDFTSKSSRENSVEDTRFPTINGASTPIPIKPAATSTRNESQATSSAAEPSEAAISLEYSPIRHRTAIERVLASIRGADPKIDSAVKLWTTFAVSQYFEITNSPLTDYIVCWLRAYPNSYFLEVLPEISFRIADGLEVYDLARDNFALLVGEEALDNLGRSQKSMRDIQKHSAFGRKRDDLPELLLQRVEYASKKFIDRILQDFESLVGKDMQWVEELSEVQQLSSHTQPELQPVIQSLKHLLKEYLRGSIYKMLCANYDQVPEAHFPNGGGGGALFQHWKRNFVWNDLSPRERVLTRTFWKCLRGAVSFGEGSSNLDLALDWAFTFHSSSFSLAENRVMDTHRYREIPTQHVRQLIAKGQLWLAQNTVPSSQLPDMPHAEKSTEMADKQHQSVDFLNTQPSNISLPFRPQPKARHSGSKDLDATTPPVSYISTSQHQGTRSQPIRIPKQSAPEQGKLNGQVREQPEKSDSNEPMLKSSSISAWKNFTMKLPNVTIEEGGLGAQKSQRENALKPLTVSPPRPNDNLYLEAAQKVVRRKATKHHWGKDVAKSAFEGTFNRSRGFAVNDQQDLPRFAFGEKFNPTPDEACGFTVGGIPVHNSSSLQTFFRLRTFFKQAQTYIDTIADRKLSSPDQNTRQDPIDLGLANTLVCLEDSEFEYLPLWAGGLDDGTGGVYQAEIPQSEMEFSTAGPHIHTGTSDYSDSGFDLVSAESSSTFNTSTATNDGFSSHMRPNRVYAASSAASSSVGDDFSMVDSPPDKDEEAFARRQIEAMELIEAAEAEAAENRRPFRGRFSTDENYADLFQGGPDDDSDGGYSSEETEMGDDLSDVGRISDLSEEHEDDDTVMV